MFKKLLNNVKSIANINENNDESTLTKTEPFITYTLTKSHENMVQIDSNGKLLEPTKREVSLSNQELQILYV
jgi:hypothetical protein